MVYMQLIQLKKKYYLQLDPLDIDLLISHVLKKTREFVLAHPEYVLNKKQVNQIEKLLRRRMRHEPVAYITGHKEFFSLDFYVTPKTLIPRPETELLVERIIQKNPSSACIIDIGAGSGNIIISLAKNIEERNFFMASDISREVVKVSRKNARFHQVDKKIKFFTGDLLGPAPRGMLKRSWFKKNNISSLYIAANLPYLNKHLYQSAPPQVKQYEPKSALLSAKKGLAHYQKLFRQLKKIEESNHSLDIPVYVFMEISPEQKNELKKMIASCWKQAEILFHKDLSRKWRVCECVISYEKNKIPSR